MDSVNSPIRQQIIHQVLRARSLSEVAAATQALQQWVAQHPEDLGIVDGFEAPAMMQECAEAKEAPLTQELMKTG